MFHSPWIIMFRPIRLREFELWIHRIASLWRKMCYRGRSLHAWHCWIFRRFHVVPYRGDLELHRSPRSRHCFLSQLLRYRRQEVLLVWMFQEQEEVSWTREGSRAWDILGSEWDCREDRTSSFQSKRLRWGPLAAWHIQQGCSFPDPKRRTWQHR